MIKRYKINGLNSHIIIEAINFIILHFKKPTTASQRTHQKKFALDLKKLRIIINDHQCSRSIYLTYDDIQNMAFCLMYAKSRENKDSKIRQYITKELTQLFQIEIKHSWDLKIPRTIVIKGIKAQIKIFHDLAKIKQRYLKSRLK